MITNGQYEYAKESTDYYLHIKSFEILNKKHSHTTYGLMKNPSSYKSMKVVETKKLILFVKDDDGRVNCEEIKYEIPQEPHETIGDL